MGGDDVDWMIHGDGGGFFGGAPTAGDLQPSAPGSGAIDPAYLAAMKRSAEGRQGEARRSPLDMLRSAGGMSPRAAAAQQMVGGGAGNISYAQAPGLIPPWVMDVANIASKVAPLL